MSGARPEPAGCELSPQSAARAVRVLALARVEQIGESLQRFLADDPEGLHDVRVAMRRLRTLLRAYRPYVDDTLKRKTRRDLNSVARASSDARDVEVAAAWVAEQADLPPRLRAGVRRAAALLDQDRDAVLKDLRERLRADLPDVLRGLSKQLSSYSDQIEAEGAAPAEPFGIAAAAALREHARRFERRVGRLGGEFDADAAHAVRIAAKRMRYLLEPLHDDARAATVIDQVTTLQDVLGTVHDAHQFVRRFVREIGERAARDARRRVRPLIGLEPAEADAVPYASVRGAYTELARRAHAQERASFRAFRRRWTRRAVEDLLTAVESIALELDGVRAAP